MNCDTCEYKFPGEVPGEGEWVCNNGESERYAETVRPEECCKKYKKPGELNLCGDSQG